ncbi:hypothetical protein [Kingella oralis]|uniref:hypothetical protein n=1 Tax=Kingella oralis TaxID=505 RepID=UPI002D7EF834|nr:hypothetical protein [Kingella oralis]
MAASRRRAILDFRLPQRFGPGNKPNLKRGRKDRQPETPTRAFYGLPASRAPAKGVFQAA